MKKTIDLKDMRILIFTLMTVSMYVASKVNAQTRDTLYYNAKWEKTDRENRHFYRVVYREDNTGPIRVQDYYPNGMMQMDGWYSSLDPEVRDGEFTWWHEDGKKHRWMMFDKGEPTKITEWDSNGKITRQQEKVNTISHENGEKIRKKKALEKAPVFDRGRSSFRDYVVQHLKYPTDSEGTKGQVIVRFVVDRNGKTKDAEVVQSLSEAFDKAALDLIKSLPMWTPGVSDGRNVDIKMELPLNF